ncbi:MAG: HAD hydrolase family protein [Propionibacterium sp.]|nr:HAD hydrolase family protein [Propionibacterium sp.]
MEIPEVVLLDIDGTLVDYGQNLPASAAEAVRAARARGHGVYLCTGRSRAEIYDDLWALGMDGLIGGNGSYVEAGGVVVHHQVLDPEVAHRAVEWMLANDLVTAPVNEDGLAKAFVRLGLIEG